MNDLVLPVNALSILADLKVQAMLFDMDIDIETVSLTEAVKQPKPAIWLTMWKDRVNQADEGAEAPGQNLGEQDDRHN